MYDISQSYCKTFKLREPPHKIDGRGALRNENNTPRHSQIWQNVRAKKCGETKPSSEYSGRQTKCKPCFNEDARAKREQLKSQPLVVAPTTTQECTECKTAKVVSEFYNGRKTCNDCFNEARRVKASEYKDKAETLKKTCTSCGVEKSGTEYAFCSGVCKPCFSEKNREEANRPADDAPPKMCRKCGIEQPAVNFRHHEATCKECCKKKLYEWRDNNSERFLHICKNYRDKESSKLKRAEYRRRLYNEKEVVRMETIFRNRVRVCIKKKYVPKNTAFDYKGLLGCSWEILIQWLESNMEPTMTWENYGTYWHIDHVRPCASFDFSKDEDRAKCFNWTNLMPMNGIENIKKSNKIYPDLIENARKCAIEFLIDNEPLLSEILTDKLPEDLAFLVKSGVLTTKEDVKASAGSGENSEVW